MKKKTYIAPETLQVRLASELVVVTGSGENNTISITPTNPSDEPPVEDDDPNASRVWNVWFGDD